MGNLSNIYSYILKQKNERKIAIYLRFSMVGVAGFEPATSAV
jgi:hypothetical protein